MNVVGVSLVAIPYAIAKLIVRSKFIRVGAILSLIAYASTRNYRRGEGPLTPKMVIQISPGEGIGGLIFSWGEVSPVLKKMRGRIMKLTQSEAESLGAIVHTVQQYFPALPILEDWIARFPR